MDNTEIHYITYDPKTIWRTMMDAYAEAGGETLYSGDEKEILLRAVQQIMVQAFATVDNALRMATRRYAVRDYLDLYGESHFVPRIQSVAAEAEVEVHFNAGTEAALIPAGSQLTQDGVMMYALKEDIAPSGSGAETVTVGIVCKTAGIAGNALEAGLPMQFLNQWPRVGVITSLTDARGGVDTEEDEPYRARIVASWGNLVAGTKPYYEALALSVDTRIIDAVAIRSNDGEVTVYLLLDSGMEASDKAAVINAAEAALKAEDARALTDSMIVLEADALTYTLNVTVQIPAGTASSALTAVVTEYQEWQESQISRPFNPDKLVAMLYQAGAERVTIDAGSEFDGGTAEYTELGEGEYCTGSVNITVTGG